MRRLMLASAALAVSALFVGCSGSKDNAGNEPGVQQGPEWQIALNSKCLNASTDQCVGRYGFTVGADGKFLVGPGPKGQVLQGQLADGEFSELKAKLNAAIATARFDGSREEGHEAGIENEGDDTLLLSRRGAQNVLAHNSAGDFYFATDSHFEAKAVHVALRDLAKRYYRLPFGNDCADSSAAVEALYAGVQECQTDVDCVYVDAARGYSVVAPNSLQYILQDECTSVTPMLVAHKTRILDGAQAILQAYSAAAGACGAEFTRADCRYQYATTGKAPTCVQNRCQASL